MANIPLSIVAAKAIISSLGYSETVNITKTNFAVLVGTNEVNKALQKISSAFSPFNPKISSDKKQLTVGGVNINLRLKKNKKQSKSLKFGVKNELNFVEAIREYIEESDKSLNIDFRVNGRSVLKVYDIKRIDYTAKKDPFARNKADVHLVSNNGTKTPISLKKTDAGYWESADTYFKIVALFFLDYAISKNYIELMPILGMSAYKIHPSLSCKMTQKEKIDVCFGNDILGNGGILVQTFSNKHFSYDEDNDFLNVECKEMFLRPEDIIGEYEPYLQIRNDQTRKTKDFYPGLRIFATPKKNLGGDKIVERPSSIPRAA